MDFAIFNAILELRDRVQKQQLRVTAPEPVAGGRGDAPRVAISRDETIALKVAQEALDLRARVQKVIDDPRVAVPDRDIRDILRGANAPLPLSSEVEPNPLGGIPETPRTRPDPIRRNPDLPADRIAQPAAAPPETPRPARKTSRQAKASPRKSAGRRAAAPKRKK
jgi:hypothetical protein